MNDNNICDCPCHRREQAAYCLSCKFHPQHAQKPAESVPSPIQPYDPHKKCEECGKKIMFHKNDNPYTCDESHPKEVKRYTYSSDQHTNCCVCDQDKHTPLRLDEPDGYVCLSCIVKVLRETQADCDSYETELEKLKSDYAAKCAELDAIKANPAVGTCCVCSATIWRNQERIEDERGLFHPICMVAKEKKAAESRVSVLTQALEKAARLIHSLQVNDSWRIQLTMDEREIFANIEKQAREALNGEGR